MILIIGGAASGKRTYARSLGYSDDDMSSDAFSGSPVIFGVEEIVRREPDKAMELLPVLIKKEAVIVCEVGSGIIPVDRRERYARETTGRLTIALAKEATEVIRMVAGLPQRIK